MSSLIYPVHVVYRISDDIEFEFSPAPFIQVDRSIDLSGTQEIGSTFTINFTGTLVAPKHLVGEGIRPEAGNDGPIEFEYGLHGMSPLERQRRKMEEILSIPGGVFRIYCRCPEGDNDCLGQATYFEFYPNIIGAVSFQTSPDNWVTTIPYTFSMVMHRTNVFNDTNKPLYLESIDENWSLEFVDEKTFFDIDAYTASKPGSAIRLTDGSRLMRITHTLTATGKRVYGQQEGETNRLAEAERIINNVPVANAPGTHADNLFHTRFQSTDSAGNSLILEPHEYARQWILTKLDGIPRNELSWMEADGIFNYNELQKYIYNHTRQKSGNAVAGTYSITESWIVIVGGTDEKELWHQAVTDEYTVNYRSDNQSGIDTVSIEGTITGLQEGDIDWTKDIGTDNPLPVPKINKAENFLYQLMIQNIFHKRAEYHLGLVASVDYDKALLTNPNAVKKPTCLNSTPTSRSIRKQLSEGVISYSWEFSTKQDNLFDDTVAETFSTSITYPNDVFAQVTIPGRQRGPLFFSANTHTSPKYTLNFELVLRPECLTGSQVNWNRHISTNPDPHASLWSTTSTDGRSGTLQQRVRNSISTRRSMRDRIITISRVHYDYIRNVLGGEIRKIESDNDTWNAAEGRYSGSLTFTFGACSSNNYLIPLTRAFEDSDNTAQDVVSNTSRSFR